LLKVLSGLLIPVPEQYLVSFCLQRNTYGDFFIFLTFLQKSFDPYLFGKAIQSFYPNGSDLVVNTTSLKRDDKATFGPSAGAERVVRITRLIFLKYRHKVNYIGLNHWLLGLVEIHGRMLEEMVEGIDITSLKHSLYKKLYEKDAGDPMSQEELVRKAGFIAYIRRRREVTERDLAVIVLAEAGYWIDNDTDIRIGTELEEDACQKTGYRPLQEFTVEEMEKRFNDIFDIIDENFKRTLKRQYYCRNKSYKILERYCRNLTMEACKGKLGRLVGREEEIQLIIETLCRRTKRNPILVGPAGSGKTAIIEGLANKIVLGKVPKELCNVFVYELQPSVLVAMAVEDGGLEKVMKEMLAEASQPDVILFIDEAHTIIGSGGLPGTSDIASMLKPPLARGDIACIATTTEDEYYRFIEPDPALARRFQPIRVQELSAEETLKVVSILRDELRILRKVWVSDHVLRWLVYFAQQFIKNRHFPDKAVDILEQCVSHAITQGKNTVDQDTAEYVAQRIAGMPLDLEERLHRLKTKIKEDGLLNEDEAINLLNRLSVTMRGFDMQPGRPNAVVLLLGQAACNSLKLAETIAECLYGAVERTVSIDFSRMQHHTDVSMLIGAAPGYVGYRETLPIHRVLQMPCCVLRLENIHSCHPKVRELVTKMLSEGVLVDTNGRKIYLSDTIVLVTASITLEQKKVTGFRTNVVPRVEDLRGDIERELGSEFFEQVDVVCTHAVSADFATRHWIQHNLLNDLSERLRKMGIRVCFDDSIIDWLLSISRCKNKRDWERLVDGSIGAFLARYLPEIEADKRMIVIKCENGEITAEIAETKEKQEKMGKMLRFLKENTNNSYI